NLIGENQQGGLVLNVRSDGRDQPAMVALVAQNEFDTNGQFNLWVREAQSVRVVQNRFLSTAIDGNMVPMKQVMLGDPENPAQMSFNGTFEQNYHRSTKAGSAPLHGYWVHPSNDPQGNRFLDNQLSAAVNSDGLVHYQQSAWAGNFIREDNRVRQPAPV